tara:strand:- start:389 stop:586 length:198 start_codon:yes stop_codon:yes gene_type:complete
LGYAAGYGYKQIIELLIDIGANLNAKSEIYGTPLDTAIKYNQSKIVDLLRKHGGKTGEESKIEGK